MALKRKLKLNLKKPMDVTAGTFLNQSKKPLRLEVDNVAIHCEDINEVKELPRSWRNEIVLLF